jgi:hypothetical protein
MQKNSEHIAQFSCRRHRTSLILAVDDDAIDDDAIDDDRDDPISD